MEKRNTQIMACKLPIYILHWLSILVLVISSANGQKMPLPNKWKKAIVPIEFKTQTSEGDDTLITVGTGFLVHNQRNILFVVTCKHVVKNLPNAYLSFHVKGTNSTIPVAIGSENFHFVFHENTAIDIAVSAIPTISGAELDIDAIGFDLFLSSDSIFEGEEVLFLGFPMRIGSNSFVPVCREGIIALAKETDHSFLIEGTAFPGNSGGPIFLRPVIYDFRTNSIGLTKPYFIGLVSQYIPYRETAISIQTGRPRIHFEENSGLIRVVPSEYVREMIGD